MLDVEDAGLDIDEIPEHAYREASLHMLRVIDMVGVWLLQRRLTRETEAALWQVAFALGLSICDGKSMEKIAAELRLERAAISKGAREFLKKTKLPPSAYMRSAEACESYKECRLSQLESND